MRTGSRSFRVSAVFLFAGVLPLLAQADWAIVKKIPVGGAGRWDYLTVDPHSANR
jgi:hypothetical protein